MSAMSEKPSGSATRETCRVVVLYDGAETRTAALEFSDHLRWHFSDDLDFEIAWWRADFLEELSLAELAAAQAAEADVILVCIRPDAGAVPPMKTWFTSWAAHHIDHDAALVELEVPPPAGMESARHFFREAARAAGLDYLEPAAENASARFVPVSWDLLRDDLPAPEHYGLNE